MPTGDEKMDVRMDRYTRVCLTVIAVLLTVLIMGLWADQTPDPPRADAAKPFADSGAQRKVTQDIQMQTNEKLDELGRLLKSGEVKVQIVEGAEKRSRGANVIKSGSK